MLDAAQQLAVEKPVVFAAYFAEFQFAEGIVRVCSYGTNFDWGGYTWVGLGSVSNISPVEEAAGMLSPAMTFTLNVAQIELLSLAVGNVENYRGKPAKLYFCPLTETGQLVGSPVVCWRGTMDTCVVGVDGEQGQIYLKCETSAFGLKRLRKLRLNDAQWRQRNPGDAGLSFLNDLIANPQLWLSRKFQMI